MEQKGKPKKSKKSEKSETSEKLEKPVHPIIKAINEKFGKIIIRRASDPLFRIRKISTGVVRLDKVLGGGYPVGRIIEIYGSFSTCKTRLALEAIKNFLDAFPDVKAIFIDTEGTFDPKWAIDIGIDLDRLEIVSPAASQDSLNGHEIVDIVQGLIATKDYCCIVIDSSAAMLPKEEEGKSAAMEAQQPGNQARMMSAAMRRWVSLNTGHCSVFLINQVREKIGAFVGGLTTPGGRAVGFYASVRLELRKASDIVSEEKAWDDERDMLTDQKVIIGARVAVKVTKEKTGGAQLSKTTFDYLFENSEIDNVAGALSLALQIGLVKKSGAWFSYLKQADIKAQGRDAFKRKVVETGAIEEIKEIVLDSEKVKEWLDYLEDTEDQNDC
jgi:recombination protein RecA